MRDVAVQDLQEKEEEEEEGGLPQLLYQPFLTSYLPHLVHNFIQFMDFCVCLPQVIFQYTDLIVNTSITN